MGATKKQAFIDLPAVCSAGGVVRLPGSKSLSNRLLLLSALSAGETEISGLLASDDTARMLDALRILGVRIESQGRIRAPARWPARVPIP